MTNTIRNKTFPEIVHPHKELGVRVTEIVPKDSGGRWAEYRRDADGNELTYNDSDGHCIDRTRDADGNELIA